MEGARAPGSVRKARPLKASKRPIQTFQEGRSPARSAPPIIVTCTAPNKRRAPTPAGKERYAKENAAAYANNAAAEAKLPPRAPPAGRASATRTRVPETSRMAVKLAASIRPAPRAPRQRSEFAA